MGHFVFPVPLHVLQVPPVRPGAAGAADPNENSGRCGSSWFRTQLLACFIDQQQQRRTFTNVKGSDVRPLNLCRHGQPSR